MIKELKYSGLTNISDDYSCSDGDLAAVVNLVNENGNLKPFVPPKTIMNIQGVLCCVHKGSSYENYITVSDGDMYSQSKTGDRVRIAENVGNVINIEVIGNTIIVISDRPLKYLLHKDGQYTYLGEKPPMPEIKFSTTPATGITTEAKMINVGVDLHKDTWFDEAQSTMVTERIYAPLNKLIADARDVGYYIFPCFVRYALRLYDGSLYMHSMPFPIYRSSRSDYDDRPIINSAFKNNVGFGLSREAGSRYDTVDIWIVPFTIKFKWNGFPAQWSDIVKSIDLFVSEPIYDYDQSEKIKSANATTKYRIDLPFFPDKETDSYVSDISRFYKIFSIPSSGTFKDFANNDVSIPYEVSNLNALLPKRILTNITLQELMTDEYNSHHSLSARNSYVYNNRLHISNLKIIPFEGFNIFNASTFNPDSISPFKMVTVCVYLKIDGSTVKLKREYGKIRFSESLPYLYYPDSRAFKMEVIVKGDETYDKEYAVIELKSHQYLNGAYYYESQMGSALHFIPLPQISIPGVDVPSEYYAQNKLQVSESGNPFMFKPEHMYTIGTSEIKAIVSSTRALSQGQFGQFPLYVFSGEGVWAMEVSNTGTYSSRQMVARDVCNNPESVLQMDGSVAFTSNRGVMLIQGSDVICISSVLDGSTFRTDHMADFDQIASATGTEAMITAINGSVPFSEFIKGSSMAYDYPNARILVINEAMTYAYVYNINSQSWSTVFSKYVKAVNNYPDSYLVDGLGNVSNISSVISNDDPTVIKGVAISRPLKLGAPDTLKSVSSLIHRGLFRKNQIKSVLYGSRDGLTYVPIASSADSYIRRVHGSPYKFFRVVLIADMSMKEAVSGTSIEYEAKFINKLR